MTAIAPTGATILDVSIAQGASFTSLDLVLTCLRPDGSGLPRDLTGCSAHMSVRRKPGDTTSLLDLTDANGLLVLGGAAGTISPNVPASTMAAFVIAGGWDLFIQFPDGSRAEAFVGAFNVVAANTRYP